MKKFVVLLLFLSGSYASISQCVLSLDNGYPIIVSPRCGNADGSIEVSATGIGAVTYQLNGGAAQANGLFENLGTSTYTITITDESGCQIAPVFPLEGEETITINSIDVTESDCDANNGRIVVNAEGLTLQYALNNGPFQNSNVFNGLGGGTYTVRVRDVNQCVETEQAIVPQGTILLNDVIVVHTNCFDSNGQIIADATGNGLTYQLEGVTGWQASPSFTGLAPGVYTLQIQDADGCILSRNYRIRNDLDYNLEVINPLCGQNNGSIIITVGTPGNYEYSIDDGATFQNTGTFNNLAPNTYPVVIRMIGTDCVVNIDVPVNIDPEVIIDNIILVQPICNGSNGQIEVQTSGTGVVSEYILTSATYSASNTTGIFPNLPADSYAITLITDADCEVSGTADLTEYTDIVVNGIATTPSSCTVPEGQIVVDAVSTDNEILRYSLDGVNFNTSPIFPSVVAGIHTLTVQSDSGCSTQIDVNVPSTTPIIISELATTIPSSNCSADGEIIIFATGGDLQFSLDNQSWQTSNIIGGLNPGNYTVYIRSSYGCTSYTGNISLPSNFYIEAIDIVSSFCDRPEGQVTINAIGNEMLYRVDDGVYQENNHFTDLSVGMHTAYVLDLFDCEISQEFEVTSSGNVFLVDYEIFYPECSDTNAAIALISQWDDETTEVNYWMDGITPSRDSIFYSLPIGVHRFYAEDNFGCTDTLDVEVTETSLVSHDAIVEDYICFNHPGRFSITHTGGLAPFQYSLDSISFQSSNYFSGFNEGTYPVYIIDRIGCASRIDVEVGYQCEAMVPNAITPGNDGINDRLVVLHEQNLYISEFRVFNSWGEMIYRREDFWSQEQEQFWDGIDHSQQPGDQNVFLYEVLFTDTDGSGKQLKGIVHLLR